MPCHSHTLAAVIPIECRMIASTTNSLLTECCPVSTMIILIECCTIVTCHSHTSTYWLNTVTLLYVIALGMPPPSPPHPRIPTSTGFSAGKEIPLSFSGVVVVKQAPPPPSLSAPPTLPPLPPQPFTFYGHRLCCKIRYTGVMWKEVMRLSNNLVCV